MQSVIPAISADRIVTITPSVLSAGGNALDLNGLILTDDERLPTGIVLRAPTAASVAAYFGATSQLAALASIYFLGFANSNVKPGGLLFYRYPWKMPAAAFLRGGNISGLRLSQLQALNAFLSITIDGVLASATINMAAATSFSSGAQIIETGLNIDGPVIGTFTGEITDTTLTVSAFQNGKQTASFVGAISGNTLTVSQMHWGNIEVGTVIDGLSVTPGTMVTDIGSADAGGVGTFVLNNPQTRTAATMSGYSSLGELGIGSKITSDDVAPGTFITGFVSGFGGVGTYTVNLAQAVATGDITGHAPAVSYDSLSGGYTIFSSTAGPLSTITEADGPLATSLKLSLETAATVSQGAEQATAPGAMGRVVNLTQDWAQFMTSFEPYESEKVAFAEWVNGSNNRYAYACQNTNQVNITTGGPSDAVEQIIGGDYSGVSLIYEDPSVDTMGQVAAFVLGYGASIDFTEIQGRATAAFKHQTGLPAHVFDDSIFDQLEAYGMNLYGDFTTANQAFLFYYPGSLVGPFKWLDSYLNQIWLNNQLQLSLMVLLTNAKSIPYNERGRAMIGASMLGVIGQAVSNGVIQAGVNLSEDQKAQVNNSAGQPVDTVISRDGWYLQIREATPDVRMARGSPPITLWYADGQSVQKIDVASINVQ
jgi:hypothetical protein